MVGGEKTTTYVSKARQLAPDLKALAVDVTKQELVETVFSRLTPSFKHLIVPTDALCDDDKLSLVSDDSRLLQKEQRIEVQYKVCSRPSAVALAGRSNGPKHSRKAPAWSHCNERGQKELD